METLLLYHQSNKTLSTLCRLCLDQSGTTDIFMDISLPDKIYSITGIKVDNVNPYPNKICDNCCGLIQLTLEFRESVVNNDKHLHDFIKVYLPSEILPICNGPQESNQIPEKQITEPVNCHTVTKEERSNCTVQPVIRVRSDLFQVVDTSRTESTSSLDTLIIDEDCSLAQSNDGRTSSLDDATSDLYVDEKNTLDANERSPTAGIDIKEEQPFTEVGNDFCVDETANESQVNSANSSNLTQDFNKDRYSRRFSNDRDWEISILCEPLEDDSKHVPNTYTNDYCIKKTKKHTNTAAKHEKELVEREDVKLSKRIKFDEDREYKCDWCSKYFMTSKKLYCHKRIHNKKHVCVNCNKPFATKGDLQRHTRTHTKEKPFKCDKCKKKFSQKILLRFHKKTIHGIVMTKADEENAERI